MSPELKAEEIKKHFQVKMSLTTEVDIVKSAQAYIGKVLDDFNPIKSVDYKLGYEKEWVYYASYWLAVLEAL